MKDPVHHVTKINRQVLRSVQHEVEQGSSLPNLPPRQQTERQLKKQAKQKIRQEKLNRASTLLTPEEQNKKMLHRVPIFDRISHDKPLRANKISRKKVP